MFWDHPRIRSNRSKNVRRSSQKKAIASRSRGPAEIIPGDRPDPRTGDLTPGPFLIQGRSAAIRGVDPAPCTCRSKRYRHRVAAGVVRSHRSAKRSSRIGRDPAKERVGGPRLSRCSFQSDYFSTVHIPKRPANRSSTAAPPRAGGGCGTGSPGLGK